ncbi:MAG: hypothetical protein WB424_10030, partial [Terracidiphilus sp.]
MIRISAFLSMKLPHCLDGRLQASICAEGRLRRSCCFSCNLAGFDQQGDANNALKEDLRTEEAKHRPAQSQLLGHWNRKDKSKGRHRQVRPEDGHGIF